MKKERKKERKTRKKKNAEDIKRNKRTLREHKVGIKQAVSKGFYFHTNGVACILQVHGHCQRRGKEKKSKLTRSLGRYPLGDISLRIDELGIKGTTPPDSTWHPCLKRWDQIHYLMSEAPQQKCFGASIPTKMRNFLYKP